MRSGRREREARRGARDDETDRRDAARDRRDDAARRHLDTMLDPCFRPGHWAARLADAIGLQSGRPVRVDERTLAVARPEGTRPLRIALASDFHAGVTTAPRLLAAACARLHALRPDVLLLAGDFVSVRASDIHALAQLLATVHAPLGKFGVFGNHDLRANRAVLSEALAGAGVRMLVNEVVRLPAPHDDVHVAGIDDPIRGTPQGEILDAIEGTRILLMHAPDGVLVAGDRHYDLAFCGHTHGGQVVLPGGAIPYLPHGALSREYPVGAFDLGTGRPRMLLVSRGVGCSTIPVRLNCPAEVHLVTIAPRPRDA